MVIMYDYGLLLPQIQSHKFFGGSGPDEDDVKVSISTVGVFLLESE